MKRSIAWIAPLAALLLVPSVSVQARQNNTDAMQLAQQILDEGAAKFNTKDAPAMAATYTNTAEVVLINMQDGRYQADVRRGRSAIEALYRDVFKEVGSIQSKNTVEFARLLTPDLLVIHGVFQPNQGTNELPFVQIRVKQDGHWRIQNLQLFLASEN